MVKIKSTILLQLKDIRVVVPLVLNTIQRLNI